jgi:ABC-type Zn uptake system ZnuABC Zn-binding protein ZnuA
MGISSRRIIKVAIFGFLVGCFAPLQAAGAGRLAVAVTESDIEAIVKAVGGDQVQTFSLFRGCILHQGLSVEEEARPRLLTAEAIVWTGFFNESSAIFDCVKLANRTAEMSRPAWIDVSRGAHRVNIPTSTCEGYIEMSFMYGDPFFWLNPRNGGAIAANVAEGLIALRPAKQEYFLANAASFKKDLEARIAVWQEELKPLEGLRVFCTQCGWQNFAQMGGPVFVVCKGKPGELPTPESLVDHVNSLNVQVVLVDPNTPPQYARAFRERTKARVVPLPSSIEKIPGAKGYFDLFDNMIQILKQAAKS